MPPRTRTTEDVVTGPVQAGPDPDTAGITAALAAQAAAPELTPDQIAQAEVDQAAQARSEALIALSAVAETPLTVPPPPKFAAPDYQPTGEVHHWEQGGQLYLVKSRLYNVSLPDGRFVTAEGGAVVELTAEHAARGLELGQIIEYSPPTTDE